MEIKFVAVVQNQRKGNVFIVNVLLHVLSNNKGREVHVLDRSMGWGDM